MSADAGEDEAVLDVKVPTRRRRASDDEADEVEFHDATECAASVADSQAVDREDQVVDESRSVDGYENGSTPGLEGAGDEEVVGTEEPSSEQDQTEQVLADQKKAKLREPFEVPTSGAFWLHDDRFGGDEPQTEAPRPSGAVERKARSDTEGRWLHDKFGTLELGEAADDDDTENAFSNYRRGRGRGIRSGGVGGGSHGGGVGGGGRGSNLTAGGRGRGVGRGRGGRYVNSTNDSSEPVDAGIPALGLHDTQEALPQRQLRAPRSTARSPAVSLPFPLAEDPGVAGNYTAATLGSGRGRGGPPGVRGGSRSGEPTGRGRGERSRSLEPPAAPRDNGFGSETGSGRGRGLAGRGRGREGASRDDGVLGRGGYGRGVGRGYAGRGTDAAPESNGGIGAHEGGRGRGRSAGRSAGDYQGRGSGLERGFGAGRGLPPGQQQPYRKADRVVDEEFPPLPSSGPPRQSVAATLQGADMPPGVSIGGHAAAATASAVDAAAPATQGVRRYSRMAGKVGGGPGGAGDANAGFGVGGAAAAGGSGATAAGPENGHARGGAGEGGAPARTSKLSAAAPTFEPSPAAAAAAGHAGRQPQQAQQAPPHPQQQPVPSVPMAFGAPLQPMTVVATGPPVQPMAGMVSEQQGGGFTPQTGMAYMYQHPQQQHMQHPPQQHMQQQHMAPPPMPQQQHTPPPPPQQPQQQQQHTQAPPQQVPTGGYMAGSMQQQQHAPVSGVPQQGGMMGGGGGSPMAQTQGSGTPYAFMGAMMYGASPAEVEAWYQDAYQKALATGMDPQQAYSAVQGYVQGLNMAYTVMEQQRRQQQQMGAGAYGGSAQPPPQMQVQAPPAGVAAYETAAKALCPLALSPNAHTGEELTELRVIHVLLSPSLPRRLNDK
ncbi:hypothetical protein VOLCADRAFT_92106 [Volvox carteri f. nagariensis]|uniref:Btz domain-containing protein n=1 Tax=Volvox carteri f. nagariensis TaxID=3068 RepID=D8TYL8_VOLCA|nr:uncharacterized protein VOLCADRAFT_92106 [Volvox carteri f. nagariensis]EFJ47332.1 hypothetical protein VOLCADRAFT_92106 [Volvox carteri f. nagariensis]|eukprot:XP_002951521.1 hypothetical protein VOLCADRAFT_92106 [Volvox carteri f. nagariensis]